MWNDLVLARQLLMHKDATVFNCTTSTKSLAIIKYMHHIHKDTIHSSAIHYVEFAMIHTLSNRTTGLSISLNALLVHLKLMHLSLSYTDVLQIVHLWRDIYSTRIIIN